MSSCTLAIDLAKLVVSTAATEAAAGTRSILKLVQMRQPALELLAVHSISVILVKVVGNGSRCWTKRTTVALARTELCQQRGGADCWRIKDRCGDRGHSQQTRQNRFEKD